VEKKLKNLCAYPNGVQQMGSHQNHSCVTLNFECWYCVIGMCTTSSESSHWGDYSPKISLLLI